MSGEEEGAESFTLDALTPTLSNTSSGGEDHGGDEDEEEEDADLEDTESGGGKHGERKQHAGGMAQRLGYLVLRGPREIEGTPYVHIYSLAEWQDTDFWRALVAGTLPSSCSARTRGGGAGTNGVVLTALPVLGRVQRLWPPASPCG
jgi:hypothetical protein